MLHDAGKIALASALAALILIPHPLSAQVSARVHAERSFSITLRAPVDAATSAFGPVVEQAWSPDWRPAFIHPSRPAAVEGAVFTVDEGPLKQIWLLQTWDLKHHVVRYVAVDPHAKVSVITITVSSISGRMSRATVSFARTALSAEGDAQVRHFAAHFVSQAPHWESAINAYFTGPGGHRSTPRS